MVTSWIQKEYARLYELDDEHVHLFRNQLLEIQMQLTLHPFEFGEPVDYLRKLDLTRCLGFHQDLIINYGIHQEENVVFVTRLRWRKRAS